MPPPPTALPLYVARHLLLARLLLLFVLRLLPLRLLLEQLLLADPLLLLLQLGAEPRLPLLLGQPAPALGARVAREAQVLHHLDARGEGLAGGRHVGVVHAGGARTLPAAARPPVAELGARLLPAPVDERLLGGRLALGAALRPGRLLRLGLARRLGLGLGPLALLLGALIRRPVAHRLRLVHLLLRARQHPPLRVVLEALLGTAPLGGALDGEELPAVLEQLAARLRKGGRRGSASGRPRVRGVCGGDLASVWGASAREGVDGKGGGGRVPSRCTRRGRRPAPALVRCRAAAPRPPVRSRGGSALSHTRRATGEGSQLAWPRSGGSSSRLRSESEACFLSCDAKSSKALRGLRSSPDFFRFPEGESIGDGLLPLAPAPEDEAGLGLAGLAAGRGEGGAAGTRTGACATAGFGGGAGAGAGACETAVARSM